MGGCTRPPRVFLVMEYCSKGNLYNFLRDDNSGLNMTMIYKFAIDTARGMKYLHRRAGIINRDLKSRNLLIDSVFNVKVCDFGLSRYIRKSDKNTLTAVGTPYWTAPEVIRQEPYDTKADVYSFGIVLWELITRDEPYAGMPGLEAAFAAADRGLRPKIPAFCPDDYRDLMTQCWQVSCEAVDLLSCPHTAA